MGVGPDARLHDPSTDPDRPPDSAKEPTVVTTEPDDPTVLNQNAEVDQSMADTQEPKATPSQLEPQAKEAAPAPDSLARRVSVSDLHAYYGDTHAVKGIALEFEPNRTTAIIGPSGCGKSTMVRCLNRMHEEIPGAYSTGKVLLDDLDVYDPSLDVVAVRRAIGMVFQKPNPFPTMSVFDNVASGLRLTGRKGKDLNERVERSLRGAGLWDEVKD